MKLSFFVSLVFPVLKFATFPHQFARKKNPHKYLPDFLVCCISPNIHNLDAILSDTHIFESSVPNKNFYDIISNRCIFIAHLPLIYMNFVHFCGWRTTSQNLERCKFGNIFAFCFTYSFKKCKCGRFVLKMEPNPTRAPIPPLPSF